MCLVCDRIQMIKEGTNQYFVKELQTGYVVIGDHQHFRGYTLFLCKQHKSELYELDPAYRAIFLEEMTMVAKSVSAAFSAEKMNYELLGSGGNTHMHWHLFPRRAGDLGEYGNGPVWRLPHDVMYSPDNIPSEEELEQMKNVLNSELDRRIYRRSAHEH